MQLAVIHYHWNRGGVAKVAANHLLALAALGDRCEVSRVLLLHGGRAEDWPRDELAAKLPFAVELLAVEGLDYDSVEATADDRLAASLESALRGAGSTPDNTLLHWHNHALGKNVSTPGAASRLAVDGFRTLLQIHDFAEDFRPANYRQMVDAIVDGEASRLPSVLYPQANHIHYATLNRRDHQLLLAAGVEAARLHLLPNPVSAPERCADAVRARERIVETLGIPSGDRVLTYPVRGIRRKNLGEMVLWSAAAEQTWLHVTLAPKNLAERASFDRWAKFAAEQNLPCRFGQPSLGKLTFGEQLGGSDALVTTSIAEGFGMVFLEAWLAGKRLLGRDLPEITSDFDEAGIDLSELYQQLLVPAEWVDRGKLIDRLAELAGELTKAYGLVAPERPALYRHLDELLDGPTIDFARLPTAMQVEVITQVVNNDRKRRRLLELNPKLQTSLSDGAATIAANAAVVEKHFSMAELGKQLGAIYAHLYQAEPSARLASLERSHLVLESLLRVDRLHAIRVEP